MREKQLEDALRALLGVFDDMSRFVGKMALRDYQAFTEAPLNARRLLENAMPDEVKAELDVLRSQGYDLSHFFNIQHEAYRQNLHKLGVWMHDNKARWSEVIK